jgi:hypothetical protein
MINFILFYSSAGSNSHDTVAIKAKNLNDAFSYGKHWCKTSNKEFLGIIYARTFSNYL